MKLKILLFALLPFPNIAQDFKESELNTSIKEVTVFLQGAQITRAGTVNLPSGKSIFIVKGLSPYMDAKSIQVKAKGDFTILSVNHKLNYLDDLKKNKKVDSLEALTVTLYLKVAQHESRLDILKEKQSVLNQNKNLGGSDAGASLTELQQALDFYDKALSSIKSEELKNNNLIGALNEQINSIEKQMDQVTNHKCLPTGEIEVRIDAPAKTKGDFDITYLVANAGWYPNYDIRVENIEQPIALNYKADVYQNTGVDWNNVKLKFSNGNPDQSGVAPKLSPWYLNYPRNTIYRESQSSLINRFVRTVSGTVTSAENGEVLPGVNVVVKGSTIGTVTDIDGNYSITLPNNAEKLVFSFIGLATQEMAITQGVVNVRMNDDVQQLSEVIVTAYGVQNALGGSASGVKIRGYSSIKPEAKTVTTTLVENQTTVEFEVSIPYTVKSQGEKLSVDLKQYQIHALYEYYAVPKLDKDAFLIARIIDWDQYNLLEGEANLYFEDAYVGRSVLDAKSLADTLNISLGRDKNIVIGRTKVDDFSKRRVIGSNKLESRGFEIIARNKKSQPIQLTLFDQIPISAISDISIDATELSNGKVNKETGEVVWKVDLVSQKQIELKMAYEVKYPKRERVNLE